MKSYKKLWDDMSTEYDRAALKKFHDTYNKTIALSEKYLRLSDYILDFACGTGITTIPISHRVKQIYAIDISSGMIEVAKRKAKEEKIENISFRVTDIFDKCLKDKSFDAVTAFNILFFFEDTQEVIERIGGLIKSGGIFLSVTNCSEENEVKAKEKPVKADEKESVPYMRKIKMTELKSMIEKSGFKILEDLNLSKSTPNYYIAAKKV